MWIVDSVVYSRAALLPLKAVVRHSAPHASSLFPFLPLPPSMLTCFLKHVRVCASAEIEMTVGRKLLRGKKRSGAITGHTIFTGTPKNVPAFCAVLPLLRTESFLSGSLPSE